MALVLGWVGHSLRHTDDFHGPTLVTARKWCLRTQADQGSGRLDGGLRFFGEEGVGGARHKQEVREWGQGAPGCAGDAGGGLGWGRSDGETQNVSSRKALTVCLTLGRVFSFSKPICKMGAIITMSQECNQFSLQST